MLYGRSSSDRLTFNALKKLRADVVVFESFEVYLQGAFAFEIAKRRRFTVHDALYLVGAEKYGSLVTGDEFQRNR
ncbi:MAG: hypothetical protein QXL78_05265 [Methanocellales archaeon]